MEFSASKSGNNYLFVFEDLYTKWIELKPVRRGDEKTLTHAFEELSLFYWEMSYYYVTDNRKEFDNETVNEALEAYDVKYSRILPNHAQADPVARCYKTLKTLIPIYMREDHHE